MAKKKFGISPALTRGLNETISIAESKSIKYRGTLIPVTRIIFDEENPRNLALSRVDILKPLLKSDPQYLLKKSELEKLQELATSINKSGLINPVIVYKDGENYKLVAGERRCLATILLAHENIEARVFHERPNEMDLKLIQWFENTAREDLTLIQRLNNIKMLLDKYKDFQKSEKALTIAELSNITGLSTSHASRYLSLMNGPRDVFDSVKRGEITSLKKASYLAGLKDVAIREQAIIACIEGSSLESLKSVVSHAKKVAKSISNMKQKKTQGRIAKQVNLGKVENPALARCIIEATLKHLQMEEHLANLQQINWKDHKQVSQAFKYLLTILEKEQIV